VVDVLADALDVADPVTVGVGEGTGIDLVDNSVAPPGIGENGMSGLTCTASGGKKYSFKQSFKTLSYFKIFSTSSPPRS